MKRELRQAKWRPRFEKATITAAAMCVAVSLPTIVQAEGWVIDGQITGPVTNSGELDFLKIINRSVIEGDVTNTEDGIIRVEIPPGPAIEISNSAVNGTLRNAGSVSSLYDSALLLVDADIDGGVVNTGSIGSAYFIGISLGEAKAFGGGIVNLNQISAGVDGIALGTVETFGGGIANSGVIDCHWGTGISLTDVDKFEGGIANSGTMRTNWGAGISLWKVKRFDDGIVNSGLISNGDTGISLQEVDTFQGGIVNSGTIDYPWKGIHLEQVNTFKGGIVNSGSIGSYNPGIILENVRSFDGGIVNARSIESYEFGIFLETVHSFDGGIVNLGSVTAEDGGISLNSSDNFTGGIANSGSITTKGGGISLVGAHGFSGGIANSGSITAEVDGISLVGSNDFNGGIVNLGTINAGNNGISVQKNKTFDGNIDNSGSVLARGGSGIQVAGGNFSGAVTNSGRIEAAVHGISVGTPVRGGVWNSGTIKGYQSAINVEDGLGAPTVINLTDGAIHGDVLLSGTESDTVNIFGGSMDGIIDGTKGPPDDWVNFLIDGNTLFFGGGILGVDRVFVDQGTLILKGLIADNASVVLGETSLVSANTFVQNPDEIIAFIIGPGGSHGHLNADRVELAGDLQLLFDAGPLYPDRLTFSKLVSWTTRTGTFNLASPESIFLSFEQDYQARWLDVSQERIPFNTYGQTNNQYAVGTGLERGYRYPAPDAEAVAFYAPLFDLTSTADYLAFLDAVNGSTHANALQATIKTTQVVNQAIQQRLEGFDGAMDMATAADRSLWVQALGVWGHADSDRNAVGFDQSTNGVAFGVDYQFSDQNLAGVLGAYIADELDFERGNGQADIDTWQIGAYGQHDTATWYANGILTYGWNDYESNRRLAHQGENTYAKGNYDGSAFALYGEAGYKHPIAGGITLKPMLGFGYVSVDTDGFTEMGSSRYNLRVSSGSGESFTSNLGVRASLERRTGKGRLVTGEARLLWQHEFLNDHQTADASFAAIPNTGFEVSGSKFGRDSAIAGLGIKMTMTEQSELFLSWNGSFGSDYVSNSLSAGARLRW